MSCGQTMIMNRVNSACLSHPTIHAHGVRILSAMSQPFLSMLLPSSATASASALAPVHADSNFGTRRYLSQSRIPIDSSDYKTNANWSVKQFPRRESHNCRHIIHTSNASSNEMRNMMSTSASTSSGQNQADYGRNTNTAKEQVMEAALEHVVSL